MESKLKAAAQDSVGELPAGYLHLPTTPIKQEPELTDWISGDLKPVRDGVYERNYFNVPVIKFCLFKKGYWYWSNECLAIAATKCEVAPIQNLPWRGLAKNSEVQS